MGKTHPLSSAGKTEDAYQSYMADMSDPLNALREQTSNMVDWNKRAADTTIMGFAIVADEVRNLAHRSAQAAKDTAVLIEESIARSNDGKAKVDEVAAAINAITADSGKIRTLVDEVTLGSEEQSRGFEQITKAINQMEQVTQTTAANAEESATAAEEMNAQSETLKDVVARLSAAINGSRDSNPGHSGMARALHLGGGRAASALPLA